MYSVPVHTYNFLKCLSVCVIWHLESHPPLPFLAPVSPSDGQPHKPGIALDSELRHPHPCQAAFLSQDLQSEPLLLLYTSQAQA